MREWRLELDSTDPYLSRSLPLCVCVGPQTYLWRHVGEEIVISRDRLAATKGQTKHKVDAAGQVLLLFHVWRRDRPDPTPPGCLSTPEVTATNARSLACREVTTAAFCPSRGARRWVAPLGETYVWTVLSRPISWSASRERLLLLTILFPPSLLPPLFLFASIFHLIVVFLPAFACLFISSLATTKSDIFELRSSKERGKKTQQQLLSQSLKQLALQFTSLLTGGAKICF